MNTSLRTFGTKFIEFPMNVLVSLAWSAIATFVIAFAGFVISKPTEGMICAAILALIGFGMFLGRRFGRRQYRLEESKRFALAIARHNNYVLGAFYGTTTDWFDVTDYINTAILRGDKKIDVNNNLLGFEPSRARPNKLVFSYISEGKMFAENAEQNDTLQFEDGKIKVVKATQ